MMTARNIIHPPALKPGDTIGVMAPSSRIAPEDIETSATWLRAQGFNVFIHPQCYMAAPPLPDGRFTQYAGTVSQKVSALHDLVRDPEIKAVFFATGGQRAMTLLDGIDYALIAAHPKIYMGFSDSTVLLNAITARSNLVTYHGPTFKRLPRNPQGPFNLRLLQGLEKNIPMPDAIPFLSGKAEGVLFGGNMTLLCAMGFDDMIEPDGSILFLEDINEELTTFDRNFCALRRRGILDRLSGLILGQFSGMQDTGTPFGLSFEDIVREHTSGLSIPIIMNAPYGHAEDLYTLPIGGVARLEENALILLN